MGKLWIILVLVAVAFAHAKPQNDYDYWDKDVPEEYDWYADGKGDQTLDAKELENAAVEDTADEQNVEDQDKNVQEQIEMFRKNLDDVPDDKDFDPLDDYQFEDNRSELTKQLSALEAEIEKVGGFDDSEAVQDDNMDDQLDQLVPVIPVNQKKVENDNQAIFEETKDILNEDDNQEIFEETKDILNEDDKGDNFDEVESNIEKNENSRNSDDAIEETQKLINDFSDSFEDNDLAEAIPNDEDMVKENEKVENDNIELDLEDLKPEMFDLNEDDDVLQKLLADADKDVKESEEKDSQAETDAFIRQILAELDDDLAEPEKAKESFEVNKQNVDEGFDMASESEDEEATFEEINNDTQAVEKEALELENAAEILDKSEERFDEIQKENDGDPEQANSEELKKKDVSVEINDEQNDEEDTVDKVYEDLDEDLKQLFEAWDKLSKDNTEEDAESIDEDDVLQYEEKYGKPYREDLVLSQREDFENIDDSNLDDLFEDKGSEEVNDAEDQNDENTDESKQDKEPIYYSNDALVANDENVKAVASEEAGRIELPDDVPTEESLEDDSNDDMVVEPVEETTSVKTVDVENLTKEQYDDLMRQFAQVHKEALDTQSDDFGSHVAPIHITLSADEPVVIESPNYPDPYPTNNVIDWIFDGEGTGIEFNITDFSISGLFGDYLLVKPGGADDSSNDGLLFSYHLNEPRHYRFLDVDRLFVRFYSNPGMAFFRGFQFSVKLVASSSDDSELPEPEALLPAPPATLTVNLGGLSLVDFVKVQDEFRELIADMATMYINANRIDPGLNTTFEVTQIINATICNVNWPDFENCAQVRFGVPLVYEDEATTRLSEEDLKTMWETYIYQDPFALRLSRMGITEFAIPNDGRVLMVWLVIATGVVISMAMLAFALWRFSCFEDYTRMPAFSDTDSLSNEKRNLDLYPTPHQTLPPMFADNEFKWDDDSTRVDMGGFPNKGYVRDDMYDIDSDEEVTVVSTPRDRNTTDV